MRHTIIQLQSLIKCFKQSLKELRSSLCEHMEELQYQCKQSLQLLLSHVHIMKTEMHVLHDIQTRYIMLQDSFQNVNEKYNKEKQRRKELHNNLIELKGNIRVHCRIRPLLPFDKQNIANPHDRGKIHLGLYNMIKAVMELKGNIRVHCRIRPLLPFDKQNIANPHDRHGNLSEVIFAADDETLLLKSCRTGYPINEKIYNFERVFHPSESQNSVFQDVSPLITSVLDGYNVCIMAYGQTGSGKTYTMMGPHWENETSILNSSNQALGIIPRAAEELFRLIQEKQQKSHFVKVSITEVYNNEVFDLLAQDGSGVLGVKCDVITTKDGKTEVPSLTHEGVRNATDVLDLVKKGLQLRVKHSTLVHDHSSRSHLVVTLTITAHCSHSMGMAGSVKSQKPLKTKLQLVDLAGSECVGMSGVKGAALRETSFINRSLSALSDVLGALSEHCSHIPYRNSRLTHLLQDSIGGDAKLLLILCVSPCQKFTAESLQTLGFGTRARQVSRPSAKKRNPTLCNKSK
ncbi:kinesin-like protein KIF25 [Pelobates fuscus]|uniref:kinesin-like protein KIF25 n=1 Tax=Pelobates fuscus TaxID=191477 RepID=UPI002FE47263